jgi:putative beta barrel porin BBP7
MRRALIGTLIVWFAGAATLTAQMPMPSPYPNYPSSPAHAQRYDGSTQPIPTPYLGASATNSGVMPTQGYGPLQTPAYGPMMSPNVQIMNSMPVGMQQQVVAPDGSVMMVPVNAQGQMIVPNPMGQGPMNLPMAQNMGPAMQPAPMMNQGPMMNQQVPMMNQGPMMNQQVPMMNQGPMMNQQAPMMGQGPMTGQYPVPNQGVIVGPCNGQCGGNFMGCTMGCGNACNGVGGGCNAFVEGGQGFVDNGGGFGGGFQFGNGAPFGNGGMFPNGSCGQEGKMWASSELLLWFARGQNLPALVTSGVSAAQPGVLGQPGTAILFGDQLVDEGGRAGGRWTIGCWLDECQTMGIEANFFYLSEIEQNYINFGAVGQVIGRPFFNTNVAVNAFDAEQINVPGVIAGSVSVETCTQLYGAELNLRRNLSCVCNCCYSSRIDLIGGFRYMHLDDCVEIQEDLVNLSAARGTVGEGFLVDDSFMTTNDFYGGQIGLAGQNRWGCWFCDWRTLLAMGATTKTISISGSTTFLDPVAGGNPVVQPGGLLAQPSNIGTYTFNDFSIIPQIDCNFGYQFTPLIRGWVGYSFLYWSNVARSGDQINLNLDSAQIPTRAGPGAGTQPSFTLHNSDFWAMGLSLGLQFRY